MKKFLLISAMVLSPLFVFAAADNQGTVVATVNIENAKVLSQQDRTLQLSFGISNRVGVQSQVQYAVQLTLGTTTVDEHIYPEVLSFAEKDSISRSVEYTVPDTLSRGSYHLWLESKNSSGLLLSIIDLGNIVVSSSAKQSIQIVPDSCYMTVDGAGHYLDSASLSTGLLEVHCSVNNMMSSSIQASPVFEVRSKSSFGSLVETSSTKAEIISLAPGMQMISAVVPKPVKPQNYFVAFSLKSSNTNFISNTASFMYILLGMRGSIDNVVFNELSYGKGGTAKLQLLAAFSAATGTVVVSVQSGGVDCASVLTQDIQNGVSLLSIPITNFCKNPEASITLSAKDGKGTPVILDVSNYKAASTPIEAKLATGHSLSTVAAVLLLITILGALFAWYMGNRKNIKIPFISMLFFVFVMSLFLGFGTRVQADTVHYDRGAGYPGGCCGFSVNFHYNVTYPGQAGTEYQKNLPNGLTFYAAVSNDFTSDPDHPVYTAVNVRVDGGAVYVLAACGGSCGGSGTHTFPTVQPVPLGNHSVSVTLAAYAQQGNTGVTYSGCNGWSAGSLGSGEGCLRDLSTSFNHDIYVADPTALVGASPSPILVGDSSIVTWNSHDAAECKIQKNGTDWIVPYLQINYGYIYHPYAKGSHTECSWDWGGQHCYEVIDWQTAAWTEQYEISRTYIPYTNGSTTTGPLSVNTTYNLICSLNGTVAATSSATVTVVPKPVASISASSSNVYTGDLSLISWSSMNANVCGVDEGSTLNWKTGTSGSVLAGPFIANTTYTLHCTGLNNSGSTSTVQVRVSALPTGGHGGSGGGSPLPTITLPCVPVQTGSTGGNVYVNKAMTWSLTGLPANLQPSSIQTQWKGDSIAPSGLLNGSSLTKIYTTVGRKTIFATTTGTIVGGSGQIYTGVCTASTTVRSGTPVINNL